MKDLICVAKNPATAIDVHLLANVKDIGDLTVFFKYKKASSQENFEDIDWIYFNTSGEPDAFEIATSENTISGIVEKQSSYQDLKYSVSDPISFKLSCPITSTNLSKTIPTSLLLINFCISSGMFKVSFS